LRPRFQHNGFRKYASVGRDEVPPIVVAPGKPIQNAFCESFNSRLRDECLNEHDFVSLEHVQEVLGQWRQRYNRDRPHKALRWKTPEEFAHSFAISSPTETLHLSSVA
jgi:putative transposase